jgi:hypothetical protein
VKIEVFSFFTLLSSFILFGCVPGLGCTYMPSPSPGTVLITPTLSAEVTGDPVYWIELALSEWGQTSSTQEEYLPRLSVISHPEGIATLEQWFRPEHLSLIRHVDFEQFAVTIIFSGYRPTNKYGIEVNHIVNNGSEVLISVEFTSPAQGELRNPILTSPYLMTEIQKIDLPDNPGYFLVANGKGIYRATP